ncbi:MAG: DsrE/DsrF/DrsH-like family protein [Rhodocyclaceae bacterium]|nr:DsrE/DsrF/DrsH-like family protein [Rhodocyclaceae bacterium]
METSKKNVSIMCFHDELCQVFNAMMTALSLLRQGAKVTVYFGSRGVNVIHKDKVGALTCLPDMPEVGEMVMKRMDEMDLPLVEDLFFMFIAEGGEVLACPLNVPLFGMSERDLISGVKLADPARYYKEIVIPADMNLTF